MIDDVNEKIRRNLLGYSALCLAIKWLDLSVAEIAKGQFPWLKMSSLNSLLALAVFVQIYLLLRFRFSPLASRSWREMKVEIMRMIRRLIRADIKHRVENFQFFLKSSVFKPDLASYIAREEADDSIGDQIPMKIKALTPHAIRFQNSWMGEFSCASLSDRSDGRVLRKAGGYRVEFEYGVWERAMIWAKAAIPILFYTRGSVELLVPLGLGFISLLFLLFDLLTQ